MCVNSAKRAYALLISRQLSRKWKYFEKQSLIGKPAGVTNRRIRDRRLTSGASINSIPFIFFPTTEVNYHNRVLLIQNEDYYLISN